MMGIWEGIGSLVGIGANLYQQNKQFEYDKEVQQKTWEREDNAIQRRVNDLQEAGLSPVLAAGSGAQTSSPIRAQVPGAGIGNQVAEAIQFQTALQRQKQDIATSKAQEDLNKIQASNAKMQTQPMEDLLYGKFSNWKLGDNGLSENLYTPRELLAKKLVTEIQSAYQNSINIANTTQWNADRALAEAQKAKTDAVRSAWDFDLTQKYGMRSTDGGINGPLESILREFGGNGTPYGSALMGILDKLIKVMPKK